MCEHNTNTRITHINFNAKGFCEVWHMLGQVLSLEKLRLEVMIQLQGSTQRMYACVEDYSGPGLFSEGIVTPKKRVN